MATKQVNGVNRIAELNGHAPKREVQISAPAFTVAEFKIQGDAPYCQNKFSHKAIQQIREIHEAGSTARKGKKREPKKFQECFENAQHKSTDGWIGIPAPAFRNAMIDACKIVGFHMTKAKLAAFVLADGIDAEDMSPLVKITKGKPRYAEHAVRNANGVVDLRARPMWEPGWEATVRVRFDSDMFTLDDIANLLSRAGEQVGVGEGRPGSKNSCGMGWGTFKIIG